MKKILLLFILHLISVVPIYSESGNNDCFWYRSYVPVTFDENGNPVKETLRYICPDNDETWFEIQFDYKPNFQEEDEPLTIYLNEANNNKRIKSEKIGVIKKSLSESVDFKNEKVTILVGEYQITVNSDGSILLYRFKKINGKWKYASARYYGFSETDMINSTRYKVLVEKLKSIKWGDESNTNEIQNKYINRKVSRENIERARELRRKNREERMEKQINRIKRKYSAE